MPSRREVLRACGAAGVVGLAGCASDAGTTTTATTTTDEHGTPSTPASPTTEPTASDDDRVAWTRSLPGPVTGPPALAADALYVGSEDGTLTALARRGGGPRWQFTADRGIRGTPTVAGDAVLATSGDLGLGDHQTVHAVEAATGDERWSFAPNEWWLSVLGVADGTAFVASSDDHLQSTGQTLYALSLADGSTRWSVEVGDSSGGFVTDTTVYVPSTTAVDAVALDGRRRWRYEGEEYQYATLSVAGDTAAFVTTGEAFEDATVRGRAATTGDERWTFADWHAYTTRAAGDRLFVGGDRVARLDPATGEALWTTDRRAALYDTPVAGGTLYTGGDAATALAVDDGTVEWSTPLDAHIARPAGLAGDALLVHRSASEDDRDRHVLALEAATGDRRWSFAGERALTSPVVGRDRAYVAQGRDLLALAV